MKKFNTVNQLTNEVEVEIIKRLSLLNELINIINEKYSDEKKIKNCKSLIDYYNERIATKYGDEYFKLLLDGQLEMCCNLEEVKMFMLQNILREAKF